MGKLYSSLPSSFLKSVLEGENEETVEKLLEFKKLYENETDKDKKATYKERFTSAFWELYGDILFKIGTSWFDNVPIQKRLFIRFGILDLKYLSVEDQEMMKSVPTKRSQSSDEVYNSVYYVDEWISEIGKGSIEVSATDELPKKKKSAVNVNIVDKEKYDRKRGLLEAEMAALRETFRKRQLLEDTVFSSLKRVYDFSRMFDDVNEESYSVGYTESEESTLASSIDQIREILRLNKEISISKQKIDKLLEEISKLEVTTSEDDSNNGNYEVDSGEIKTEIQTVRQMIKMCVGRQGNHFPALVSSMIPRSHLKPNFRENLTQYVKDIIKLDPSIFDRKTRASTLQIVPYILLTPGYGNFGICWEPFNKYNKVSSKGRLAVPVFAKNPKDVIVMALGDFRWNMAKEMAGYHWMEEGITGEYFQYHDSIKWKGDLRSKFMYDYYLWITKESEGIQKLEKEVRKIFWLKIPFPDNVKEELSKKGYYYQDLYKKDEARKLSEL